MRGLDVLDERALQALLAEKLAVFYSVAREVHYPSTVGRKLTHRQRCDVVLTPLGRPLRLDRSVPTLFDPPKMASPEEALWLEVKVAYQFREGGVRHGGYGGQWRNAVVDDLRKMEAEPRICQAALVLIVFNESAEILEKNLELFEIVLAQKDAWRVIGWCGAWRSWSGSGIGCARSRFGRRFRDEVGRSIRSFVKQVNGSVKDCHGSFPQEPLIELSLFGRHARSLQ